MNNRWKSAGALLIFAALMALYAPACVPNESSFFIKEAKELSCDEVSPESVSLFSGLMDVRYQCGYTAILELGNGLVRRGDEN